MFGAILGDKLSKKKNQQNNSLHLNPPKTQAHMHKWQNTDSTRKGEKCAEVTAN